MADRISLRDYQRALVERLRAGESHAAASKLGVRVGGENWLVDLVDAGEIVAVPPVTPVPLTRSWFRGMTSIRGKLYSVVDFSAFLGGAPAPATDQSRLLLIGERFRTGAALLVDRSLGLRNPAELKERAGSANAHQWVKAEYTDPGGGSWKELDIAMLVHHPDFLGVAS
jgi:twitching motility protein PilI